MKCKNFAVFILTHGRPDNVKTIPVLRRQGYAGKIYLVVDDEDKTIDKYKENYGADVCIFSKKEQIGTFDMGDNFGKMGAVVYARNACFKIAKSLGVEYFLQLDDDYTTFGYADDGNGNYAGCKKTILMDEHFDSFITALKSTKAKTICMSQGGDFIGGSHSGVFKKGISRKAMNAFFFKTDNPVKFNGSINEDVNMYTDFGSRGDLFFTHVALRLEQATTQTQSGGLTDIYLNLGTYVKSFYSVMFQPSSVKIRQMGLVDPRLHHSVNWKTTVPMILSENHKKQ